MINMSRFLRYRSQFLETVRQEDLQDILERAGTEAVRLKAADLIREMEEGEAMGAMGAWGPWGAMGGWGGWGPWGPWGGWGGWGIVQRILHHVFFWGI